MRIKRVDSKGKRQYGLLVLALLSGGVLAATGEPIDTSVAAMLSAPRVQHATPLMPVVKAPTPNEAEQPVASERWLRLQASGGAASQHLQSASPTERELANQRFLNSYEYAIPESFVEDSSGVGGGD